MRACAPLTPARLRVGVPIPVGERSARRSPSQERLRRQPGAVAVLRGSAPFLAAAPTIPAAPTRAAPTARHVPPASCQRPRPPPYQPATTAKSPAAATVAAHRTFEYDAYFGTMSVLMFREDCAFPRFAGHAAAASHMPARQRMQGWLVGVPTSARCCLTPEPAIVRWRPLWLRSARPTRRSGRPCNRRRTRPDSRQARDTVRGKGSVGWARRVRHADTPQSERERPESHTADCFARGHPLQAGADTFDVHGRPYAVPVSGEQKRWEEPLDLAQVGELTALWLEGKGWAPWNGGTPDDETDPLVPYLAAMNRSGYLTTCSQPGAGAAPDAQRAMVEGLCDQGCADRLASLSLDTELIVITHYPGLDATYEIPITQEDGRTFSIAAGAHTGYELWAGIHRDTEHQLLAAHNVAVIDPSWGRNDLLWPAVVEVLQRPDHRGGMIQPQ